MRISWHRGCPQSHWDTKGHCHSWELLEESFPFPDSQHSIQLLQAWSKIRAPCALAIFKFSFSQHPSPHPTPQSYQSDAAKNRAKPLFLPSSPPRNETGELPPAPSRPAGTSSPPRRFRRLLARLLSARPGALSPGCELQTASWCSSPQGRVDIFQPAPQPLSGKERKACIMAAVSQKYWL